MSRKTSLTMLTTVAAVIVLGFSTPSMGQCCGCEGCTPGFWKNHLDAWVGYTPNTLFSSVFDSVVIEINLGGQNSVTDPTLLEALNATGGGVNALARHAVAALLNAAHPDISYPRTEVQVIDEVVAAILSGDEDEIEDLKDTLDDWNNLGCTF